jgi:glycosyltransferase involved in cell wall biosynthesis
MDTKPLKILIINSGRKWIGEVAHCFALYEELRRRSHRPILVCRDGWALMHKAREAAYPFFTLQMQGRFSLRVDLKDILKLRRIIQQEEIDLVHCHRGKDHWLAAMALLFMRRRIPLVRTRHVVMPVKQHLCNQWLYRRRTAGVIAVSHQTAQSLGGLQRYLPQGRLRVVYGAVDLERFNPAQRSDEIRTTCGIGENAVLVGLMARVQRIKGQECFLQAAALLSKKFPQARFVLAGRGDEQRYESLKRIASELSISGHVTFLGYQPNIAALMASLDVGVIASLGSEGSSRIAMEYMASGIPVVATRVGGIPELVEDGKTALLVEPGNAQALADAIGRLIDSADLRASLGKHGRDRAERLFNFDRFIQETLEFYRNCLEK